MIQLKDCNDLLKQYWKESSFSLDEAHCELPPAARWTDCRCCKDRITPLTVKGLGMYIVNLIYLEMWLIAVFDFSIRTCGCCEDKFHVCMLVFFGQSCSLSALSTQPLFGSELQPYEGARACGGSGAAAVCLPWLLLPSHPWVEPEKGKLASS